MAMSFSGSGGKTRQEQAEEFVGVNLDGDLGVGLEFGLGRIGGGQAGFERRRAANGAVGVAEGLSGGEFAGGFDFHEKIFQSDYGRIDELRDGEGIVHGESAGIAGLVQAVEIGAEDFAGGLADGILRGFEGADLFFADDDFAGDVEADHGERNAGIEDDARGFGIHIEIEFGGGSDVAAAERAAHDDDGFDQRSNRGIGFEDGGDVGERADGDDGNFARVGADDAANEFGGGFGDGLGFGFGEIHAAEAVVAVGVFGGDEAANERSGGAGGYGDVGAAGDFNQAQGVGKSERERDVAADWRDGFDVEFGGAEGEEDGDGVVDAGVGVEDDAVGFGGSGRRVGCEGFVCGEKRSRESAGGQSYGGGAEEVSAVTREKFRVHWSPWMKNE